jgi:protein involved in polysaccharide export with SLBB domain
MTLIGGQTYSFRMSRRRGGAVAVLGLSLAGTTGCNSIRNAWLDPSVVGNFDQTATLEIRSSLTLEDTPSTVPGAMYPTPDDLAVRPVDYPITAGDILAVEVFELRQRATPYEAQVVVSNTGYVNLPVVGRVQAAGLTVPGFQDRLVEALRERNVLLEPEVTVNPLFLQTATYSIFGIGVSAADNAPLRAGTFPIRRPDLRVLEAINQVGGLNEFVSEVYIFRTDNPPWAVRRPEPGASQPEGTGPGPVEKGSRPGEKRAAESPASRGDAEAARADAEADELIAAVGPFEPPAGQREPQTQPPEIEELEPESPPPFIWDRNKNEFVPNPLFARKPGEEPTIPAMPTFDTVTPAVSWARIAGDIDFRVIRIPAETLRTGDPLANIVVRGGDVIRIVSGEIGLYYVMGQVNRVGAFRFEAEPVTLKAAIAGAGGLSSLAWPDRCTVYRRIGAREQMIQVDLDRVFAGKDPDFYVRRGDIINVGTHPFAPFLQVIRGWTVPNPVNNVGYSFTYARNYADIDSFAVRQNPHNEPDRFPALFP